MLLDTHHHLWRYNETDYGWIGESMAVLKRDYLPGDLEKELAATGVTGTVVVQARQTEEETRWLLELAGEHDFIKGVVGWTDLRAPEVTSRLEAFAGHPKLAGVRHVIHDEPDDTFMLRPDFLNGIRHLERSGLTYDLLVFPRHLKYAARLAGMFPRQRFVLDHMAKPPIRSGDLHPWKEDLGALAAHANVWCKISGMVTEAGWQVWEYGDFVPYMEAVLDAFGTGRIMLGSDWPVCLLSREYDEVMSIPARYFEKFNTAERERITFRNAVECYNLNLL